MNTSTAAPAQPPTIRPPEVELEVAIRAKYRTLTNAVSEVVKRAIEFGEFLLNERKRNDLNHGQWLDWLETKCGVARRTAQRCQQLAKPENKAKIDAAMARLPDPAALSLNKAVALIGKGSGGQSGGRGGSSPRKTYGDYETMLIDKLKGMKFETAKSTVADTKKRLDDAIAEIRKVAAAQT